MEQLGLVFLIIGFVFMGEKTGKGIYGLVAGAFSLVLAITLFQEMLLFVIFLLLALMLFIINLFRRER